MTITESLCTGNSRYRAQEHFTPVGVVLHSIGTPQPNATVLRDYWNRNGSPYVVHYMVDDTQVLHCMPDNLKCWHVGSPGNGKYLGIEMGEPSSIQYTSGAKFAVIDDEAAREYARAAYNNAVWLIATLCIRYGWDPSKAVWTHHEITVRHMSSTDHVDPEHLWNGLGMGYDLAKLRTDVEIVMHGGELSTGAYTAPTQIYRIRKSWADASSQIGAFSNLEYAKAACKDGYAVFDAAGKQVYPLGYVVRVTAKSGLNVRKGPGTDYGVSMSVPFGGAYTITEEKNGWGRLKSGAGWICLNYTERV